MPVGPIPVYLEVDVAIINSFSSVISRSVPLSSLERSESLTITVWLF